jgi:hypothetical protein
MSWAEEFGKLHKQIKICLILIALLFPFWYIFLYLFAPRVYFQKDIYLIGSVILCLSITWFITSAMLSVALNVLINQFFSSKRNQINIETVIMSAGIYSVGSLVAAMHALIDIRDKAQLFKFHELMTTIYSTSIEFFIYLTIGIITIRFVYWQVKARIHGKNEDDHKPPTDSRM